MNQARQRFVASFSVLRIRDMRRVWGSQVLSEVGDWAARFALAVLVFDRSGYQYHGRVRALAESAREAGLKF